MRLATSDEVRRMNEAAKAGGEDAITAVSRKLLGEAISSARRGGRADAEGFMKGNIEAVSYTVKRRLTLCSSNAYTDLTADAQKLLVVTGDREVSFPIQQKAGEAFVVQAIEAFVPLDVKEGVIKDIVTRLNLRITKADGKTEDIHVSDCLKSLYSYANAGNNSGTAVNDRFNVGERGRGYRLGDAQQLVVLPADSTKQISFSWLKGCVGESSNPSDVGSSGTVTIDFAFVGVLFRQRG